MSAPAPFRHRYIVHQKLDETQQAALYAETAGAFHGFQRKKLIVLGKPPAGREFEMNMAHRNRIVLWQPTVIEPQTRGKYPVARKISNIQENSFCSRTEAACLLTMKETGGSPHVIEVENAGYSEDEMWSETRFRAMGDWSTVRRSKETAVPNKNEVKPVVMKVFAHSVATGVCDLHRRGIIHNDLKGNNVIYDENGKPLIIDLELAEILLNLTDKASFQAGNLEYRDPALLDSPELPGIDGMDWYQIASLVSEGCGIRRLRKESWKEALLKVVNSSDYMDFLDCLRDIEGVSEAQLADRKMKAANLRFAAACFSYDIEKIHKMLKEEMVCTEQERNAYMIIWNLYKLERARKDIAAWCLLNDALDRLIYYKIVMNSCEWLKQDQFMIESLEDPKPEDVQQVIKALQQAGAADDDIAKQIIQELVGQVPA